MHVTARALLAALLVGTCVSLRAPQPRAGVRQSRRGARASISAIGPTTLSRVAVSPVVGTLAPSLARTREEARVQQPAPNEGSTPGMTLVAGLLGILCLFLQAIPIASLTYMGTLVVGGLVPGAELLPQLDGSLLQAYAFGESLFAAYIFYVLRTNAAPQTAGLSTSERVRSPNISKEARAKLWDRCMRDTTIAPERLALAWTQLGPNATIAELRRGELEEWVCWGVMGRVPAELTPAEAVELAGYVRQYEFVTGRVLPPGRTPEARPMRTTVAPINAMLRPLAAYVITDLIIGQLATPWALRSMGFDKLERAGRFCFYHAEAQASPPPPPLLKSSAPAAKLVAGSVVPSATSRLDANGVTSVPKPPKLLRAPGALPASTAGAAATPARASPAVAVAEAQAPILKVNGAATAARAGEAGSAAAAAAVLPPIVFIHGIGIGPISYAQFIAEMQPLGREIFVVELPFVAQRCMTNVPSESEFLSSIEQAVFVGHSLGSTYIAQIARNRPAMIAGAVFIDPVCFLMHHPEITYEMVFRKCSGIGEFVEEYLVRSEFFASFYLQRHMHWYRSNLWLDDLEVITERGGRVAIIVSDKDAIVPAAALEEYATSRRAQTLGVECLIMRGIGHGGFLMSVEDRRNIVARVASCMQPAGESRLRLPSAALRPLIELEEAMKVESIRLQKELFKAGALLRSLSSAVIAGAEAVGTTLPNFAASALSQKQTQAQAKLKPPPLEGDWQIELEGFSKQLERFDETLRALQSIGASGRPVENQPVPSAPSASASVGYLDLNLNLIEPLLSVQRQVSEAALALAAPRAPAPLSPLGWFAELQLQLQPASARKKAASTASPGDEAASEVLAALYLRLETLREGAEGLQRAARDLRLLELQQLLPGYSPPIVVKKPAWRRALAVFEPLDRFYSALEILLAGGQFAPAPSMRATDRAARATDKLRRQLFSFFTAEVEAANPKQQQADGSSAGGWASWVVENANLSALTRRAGSALETMETAMLGRPPTPAAELKKGWFRR
mmetsp:Transcript_28213/g.64826  ORF Transcript_28213/g.64826 Transcript_28213/m.64826 type:complete len:1022 (-) Transcript_28213:118-3183(-)